MYVSVWVRYYLYDNIDGRCYWTKWHLVKKHKEYNKAFDWIAVENKNSQGKAEWGVSFTLSNKYIMVR